MAEGKNTYCLLGIPELQGWNPCFLYAYPFLLRKADGVFQVYVPIFVQSYNLVSVGKRSIEYSANLW
jgi:hypothetical protein